MIIHCCLLWDWHWPPCSLALSLSPSLCLCLTLFFPSLSHLFMSSRLLLTTPSSPYPLLLQFTMKKMKIEHKKQQKNGLLMDKSVLDLKWCVVFSPSKKKSPFLCCLRPALKLTKSTVTLSISSLMPSVIWNIISIDCLILPAVFCIGMGLSFIYI